VVVGVPGRVTYRDGQRVRGEVDLNQTDLPDPLARTVEHLLDRIRALEAEVEGLKAGKNVAAGDASGFP